MSRKKEKNFQYGRVVCRGIFYLFLCFITYWCVRATKDAPSGRQSVPRKRSFCPRFWYWECAKFQLSIWDDCPTGQQKVAGGERYSVNPRNVGRYAVDLWHPNGVYFAKKVKKSQKSSKIRPQSLPVLTFFGAFQPFIISVTNLISLSCRNFQSITVLVIRFTKKIHYSNSSKLNSF